MVMRLDFYVGERDLLGIGFSDNMIFRKQYYIRALLPMEGQTLQLFLHDDENFQHEDDRFAHQGKKPMEFKNGGWEFDVYGSGFVGTFKIEIDIVPEEGEPENFSIK